MYKTSSAQQLTFNDFNQSCGMSLSNDNEWCVLAGRIDWKLAAEMYSKNFPSTKGRPAFPTRLALGALIIQKRMGLSDRALVKAIAENPYYQYFIGLPGFQAECPFAATSLVGFRKRIGLELLAAVNESFLKDAPPTPEHAKKKTGEAAGQMNQAGTSDAMPVGGSLILDATCSPSNIRYPHDFSLLNEAREKTDWMIDVLHRQVDPDQRHPRTYKQVLRKAYLAMARAKSRPAPKLRSLIRRLLCALKRNLAFVDSYLERGGKLPARKLAELATIRTLYAQQKEMFDANRNRVKDRIVSISQPFIRPIIRGKARTPVEFGAKYDVSVDEKGHARLEKLSFDAYNECEVLRDAVERYFKRNGHYPARVLVDRIYRTRANRNFCKEKGIKMSGRGPGHPPADGKAERRAERQNEIDRIEIERFFSRGKRTCGAGLITTRLSETTLSGIALSVLVANLFGIPIGDFLALYFFDSPEGTASCHFLEFSDVQDVFAIGA